jgi:glyoxylase-like metal-dependent hydrolase (beta-lactamase superfamily II)
MRVRLIPGHNPGPFTGSGTNTYLLPGAAPALIDAGPGDPRHLDEVAEALDPGDGTPPASLAWILVTHAHSDHAAGSAALVARWPRAIAAKLPWPEKDARYAVSFAPLADAEVVPAGDATLWVVHTPGHAPDHVCFFEPHSGILFGGDLVVNGGTVMIPASSGGSLAHYLASLNRVLDLQPRRILPAHGPPIEQPAPLLRSYLAHRRLRERQVLDLLAEGPLSIRDLVGLIYADLAGELRGAASESVLAHLVKLRDEGSVAEEGEPGTVSRWRLLAR